MDTWDLIVLGGGLAGLTAAASAAKAGRRVLVCERQNHLGGRAATNSTEGFSLNLGPHALYPGGAAFRVLRALGIELPGAPPRVMGYAVSGGQLHTLPSGPVSLLLSGLLSPAGKWELGRVLGSLDRLDPAHFQGQSVDQVVSSLATNPGARALLRAFLRLPSYCEDTDVHCGAAALEPFLRSVRLGVFYVEGGWQTMVDRIASVAQQVGAVLRCGTGIEEIKGGDPWELRTGEGERLRARSVLLTVGPRVASTLLGSRAPELAAFAARAEPLRGACLDVALSSVPRPEVRALLGIDTPCFASLQSETVRIAPEGGGVIHLIRYLRQGERPTPEHRAELEQLLDRMQPGWRSRVVRQRWMPNLTVSHARVDVCTGLAGRPEVSLPGLPGIFLAGDWVGAEGLLADASMASASAAARAILEHSGRSRGKAAA